MKIIACLRFIYCTPFITFYIIIYLIFVQFYQHLCSIFKPTIWPADVAAAARPKILKG